MKHVLSWRILGGYAMGLGLAGVCYGAAYSLGREFTGIPAGVLWMSAIGASAMTLPVNRAGPKLVVTYLFLAASLSTLGIVTAGVAASFGAQWDGSTNPWIEAFVAGALAATWVFFPGYRRQSTASRDDAG